MHRARSKVAWLQCCQLKKQGGAQSSQSFGRPYHPDVEVDYKGLRARILKPPIATSVSAFKFPTIQGRLMGPQSRLLHAAQPPNQAWFKIVEQNWILVAVPSKGVGCDPTMFVR